MMFAIFLLLSILPTDGIVRESVDAIEINNFFSETDDETYPLTHKHVFTQIIFRNWNGYYSEHEIVAWRMLSTRSQCPQFVNGEWKFVCHDKSRIMLPTFDHAKGVYVMEWFDNGVHRRVEAVTCYESFTDFDPEISERASLPNERRLELRKK